MKFAEGKVIEKFEIEKDGKKILIIFRFPKKTDARNIMGYYNKAIEETHYVGDFEKVSLKEEEKWLRETLEKIRKNEVIYVLAEAEGKVIGGSIIYRMERDSQKHIGTFGIILIKEYTRYGIGRRMAKVMFKLAIKSGIWCLRSSIVADNRPSLRFHEKLGFVISAKFPKGFKIGKRYEDEIYAYKFLK